MSSEFFIGEDAFPAVGFGLWKIDRDETAGMVHAAIEAGYRHLDSAADYGNERETGKESGLRSKPGAVSAKIFG